MAEEEASGQRKSKSKHIEIDEDYVGRQVSRAMKQVGYFGNPDEINPFPHNDPF